MSRVKSRNTRPEIAVRRLVWKLGHRYRLHHATLPGTPDIVFKSKRKIIFVHGCYWHRHDCRRGRSTPATRIDYWLAKFAKNQARDQQVCRDLTEAGWSILAIWECELTDLPAVEAKLAAFLADD